MESRLGDPEPEFTVRYAENIQARHVLAGDTFLVSVYDRKGQTPAFVHEEPIGRAMVVNRVVVVDIKNFAGINVGIKDGVAVFLGEAVEDK